MMCSSHVERKINTTTVQCNHIHFINVLLSLTHCSVIETDDVYNSHVERKINTTIVQCNDIHFINVLLSLTHCSVIETDDV